MSITTFKTRIYLTEEQESLVKQMFGLRRLYFNYALDQIYSKSSKPNTTDLLNNLYKGFDNQTADRSILITEAKYGRCQHLYKEACDKLIWFYKCGRDDYHRMGNGKGSNKQIYSYNYDDEYIYGAFYEQYGIDLSYDIVHWWKFKALLKSLKDDTEFVKIKGYRAYTGEDKNMLELKKYWELPLPVEEQERLDKLYETLK